MPILTVEKLTKSFGGLMAVSNVNMELNQGEMVGLIGPNGAGKTTVFNLLTGVYKPSSGTVTLERDGKSQVISGQRPHNICKLGLARTFQNIRLFKDLTVLDNVRIAMNKDVKYGLPSSFLEIARAMATNPVVLLLDEPAAGMNPAETAQLTDLIAFIREHYHLTILLIEHDMSLVMKICERIYVLDYGMVIANGTPEEIKNNRKVVEAYLGEDASNA